MSSRRCDPRKNNDDELDMLIRMAENTPPEEAERIVRQHYENSIQRYVYSKWFPTHDFGSRTPLAGPNYRLKVDLRDLVATIECDAPENQHAAFHVALHELIRSNDGSNMWGPAELRSTASFDFFTHELPNYVLLYHSQISDNYRGRGSASLFHATTMAPLHIAGQATP